MNGAKLLKYGDSAGGHQAFAFTTPARQQALPNILKLAKAAGPGCKFSA